MDVLSDYATDQLDEWRARWNHARGRLLTGTVAAPTRPGERTVFVTTIVRLGDAMAAQVRAIQDRLRAIDGSHYFYPVDDVHMTVMDCTDFTREPGRVELGDLDEIRAECQAVCARSPRFELEGIGVNLGETSVFIQIITADDRLARLRTELSSACAPLRTRRPMAPGARPPWLSHANILRFTRREIGPVFRAVERMRDHRFGRLEVGHIELITTDKIMSKGSTKSVCLLPLSDVGLE